MGLPSNGEEDMYVIEEAIYSSSHPGYTFYKITLEEEEEGWDVDDSTVVEHDIQEEDTIENHTDDSQEVEETDNEVVTEDKENDEKFEDFDLI